MKKRIWQVEALEGTVVKNRSRELRTDACVAAALVVTAALAACSSGNSLTSVFSGTSGMDMTFVTAATTWDLNRDNNVSCEEWRRYQTQLFTDADKNRDGAVTQEEFAGVIRQDRLFESANFSYYNANGDSQLTLAEFTDKPNPAFRLLDKNGDCVIASEEFVRQHSIERAKDAGGDFREKQDSMRK